MPFAFACSMRVRGSVRLRRDEQRIVPPLSMGLRDVEPSVSDDSSLAACVFDGYASLPRPNRADLTAARTH